MSRATLHVLTCDRCGFSTEPRESASDRARWGVVAAHARALDRDGRDRRIGTEDLRQPEDLCPGCVEGLFAWWLTHGDVVQPAPPAPPPPPTRPVLNLDDRMRAIALVAAGLRVRIEFALEVVRQEPTAILSGEIIPGALFGIDDSAEGIVDGVLDQVGFEGYRREGARVRIVSPIAGEG